MVEIAETQAAQNPPPVGELEGSWTVYEGKASRSRVCEDPFTSDAFEPVTFNNPFSQSVERVWYDGKIVFALDAGELDIPDALNVKVAKEYQPVFQAELDDRGKLQHKQVVPGQLNIYDSVPGQAPYSPIWQFYYVEVPRDYRANALRSERDCLTSGYRIIKSNVFEN